MNREIKFRGKRVDNGEWTYGYFIPAFDNTPGIGLKSGYVSQIIPATVGQLKCINKAGKEIYEGDLVKDYDGSVVPIVWVGYGLAAKSRDSFTHYDHDWEVIGNIHDNPELLKP